MNRFFNILIGVMVIAALVLGLGTEMFGTGMPRMLVMSEDNPNPPSFTYIVNKTYPHDARAFTQGSGL